jgi:DNA-binding NarL/FixJ family response regulator
MDATETGHGVGQESSSPGTKTETGGAIRIVIADDHPIVRDALRHLLSLENDFEVVGEAKDGDEALEVVREKNPDILLLDLRMPGRDGLSVLQRLKSASSKTKVLVLTASEDKNECLQAVKHGCMGVVLKQTATDLLFKSIRKVYAGEFWLDSHTVAAVVRQFSAPPSTPARYERGVRERSPLSQREREIVGLVAQGFKNKEIAERMFISEQTVKNHLHNIFDKLGVADRLELALYAIHKGIYTEGPAQ